MNYFDEYGLPKPQGENGILFFVEMELLMRISYGSGWHQDFNKALEGYDKWLLLNPTEPMSHDNWTAITSWSYIMGYEFHKTLGQDWVFRMHPRDVIYYAFLRGGISRVLVYPFLWIMSLCMMWSMRKTIGSNGMLDTSGKLLNFVRIYSAPLPKTKWLIEKMLAWNNWTWYDLFKIYFNGDPEHPIVKAAYEIFVVRH